MQKGQWPWRTIHLSVVLTSWDTLYSSPRSPGRLKINPLVKQQPICPWLWQKLGSIKALHRYSLAGPPSKASAWHSNTLTGVHDRWHRHVNGITGASRSCWAALTLFFKIILVIFFLPLLLLSHGVASDGKMTATLTEPSGYHSR